ncbi:hypothetical protein AZI86_18375 [Bdellovibrio bacteriovorus]|uniref:RDD domain-containing protein n=1 Tax=Bdellovibrio bacteriovorus TaxID=959 RepID=A0A150WF91_BDEBC|nr:RDD family protein [Bdellovibrio bacteriovorus]KYG61662.1 hypothetical protein AZI86_18375 [Bdellovibrio bacteriovorus]
MVFPDLSAPEARPIQKDSNHFAIASVSDRLIALILDFLIFSPVVSLFIASFLKQTRTFFLLSSSSQEAFVAAALLTGLVFFLVVVLQAAFLFFWQATPGQIFLQLRVVSYPHPQRRLTLNQCFLRSFLWCTGFLLLALPFLEVASHPLRRAFHERASDTGVITLKRRADDGPHPIESRFIGSWMRMSFLLLMLFVAIGFLQTYKELLAGHYRGTSGTSLVENCKEMKDSDLKGSARLDAAFTLFLLEEISPECLNKEADVVLWENPVQAEGLGYLAKYAAAEGDEQDKYFTKVCEDRKSGVCILARFMAGQGALDSLSKDDARWWTAQFLQSEEKFSAQNITGSLQLIENLQKIAVLKNPLEKRFVRSVWTLQEGFEVKRNNGRSPASTNENREEWLEKFKERYEVP